MMAFLGIARWPHCEELWVVRIPTHIWWIFGNWRIAVGEVGKFQHTDSFRKTSAIADPLANSRLWMRTASH
jgi:hypothetical protein